jgi:hypothetical protein
MNLTAATAPLASPPAPAHAQTFRFESDFVATLRCIPMAVRFKLDRAGIKLSLRQWSRFTRDDRRRLLLAPCETAAQVARYHAQLVALAHLRANEEAKPLPPLVETPWENAERTPEIVADFARSRGVLAPTDGQWSDLTLLERFVLVKLTRDNHDNVNFVPALLEFGLGR